MAGTNILRTFYGFFILNVESKPSTQKEPKSTPHRDTDITIKETPRRTESSPPEKPVKQTRDDRVGFDFF